jgi:hypothetical protein
MAKPPWVALFKQYASLKNKYGSQFVTTSGKLLSVSPIPLCCSMLMTSAEISISQNCYDLIKQLVEQQRLGANEADLKANLQTLRE